ncbi:phage portal protein [Microbacterium sp. KKR3/1]|uniref:phage portal protein n=1 Tax=Microbacterium sp. KKR3/1 TaxID=2904241 RepID=UPI001E63C2C4|nr:phage portal protein [Microbacterium sp. KKR3/1]MCE0510854.1 phage portal protein [Microbacterium sp. KKR3/1]
MIALSAVAPTVPVDEHDADLFARLFDTWQKKQYRNLLRTVYYEGKNALRDFGIAVPPQMQEAFTPLEWIKKGVHAVTRRSVFEGFVSSSGSDDPFGMFGILSDNHFMEEFPQATTSSAIQACAFLTVTDGDVQSGEPEQLVLARSADSSAALWDRRRRSLTGFLSIVDTDDFGPSEMVMYTPERVYSIVKNASNRWVVSWIPNRLDEVSVARLAYLPELKRPFGHSRITRTAMGLTDAAVRTFLRAEVSAEFYMSDKYWLFGADVTKFIGDDKWSALMGRMNAIDVDTIAGEKIDIQRFTGSSPQPHVEQMRLIQSMFADDQNLDVKFSDASNPSSADAIYAAKEDLIIDVRDANRVWGRGAVKAFQLAVQLRDGTGMNDELRSMSAQFTDPAIVSPSARADAFSKLATSIDGFGSSPVGMKYAGLPLEDITQFQAWKQQQGADDRISRLVKAAEGLRNGDAGADSAIPVGVSDAGDAGAVANS